MGVRRAGRPFVDVVLDSGSASDGSATLDGVATILGSIPSAVAGGVYGGISSAVQQYIFTRDMYFDRLVIPADVLVVFGPGCRLFVRDRLTLAGYLSGHGLNGAVGTAGAGGAAGAAAGAGTLAAQSAGGAGGAPGSVPTSGGALAFAPYGFVNTGGTGGAINTAGAAGGAGRGGGGGGSTAANTNASGANTLAGATEGSLSSLTQALSGCGLINQTRFTGGTGGGGGRGVTAGNGGGGGGGSGGKPVVVHAGRIVCAGAGVVSVRGGDGGAAYQGALTGGQGCGGGGAGAGGWITVVIGEGSFPGTEYTGGDGGAANPTLGGAGGAGGTGLLNTFRLGRR